MSPQHGRVDKKPSWRIGVVCYPSFGGSGVIATEIAMGMAERGHEVHLLATDSPVRLQPEPTLTFHRVQVPAYPVVTYPPYVIAMASSIAEISRSFALDLVHIHYAMPHAVSAYLASHLLREQSPRFVVTLHGTDVTHVGKEPEYRPVLEMALSACDGLTTPSQSLREAAYTQLGLPTTTPIEVIPNFVNTDVFHPPIRKDRSRLSHLFADENAEAPILIHISNFRPVKRVLDVVDIFAQVVKHGPARLIFLGEGPDRAYAMRRVKERNLSDWVCFLDNQSSVLGHLQHSDVMLLPSETESFGLAALEALSCGVPVVASRIGGLSEVIHHGKTGFLEPVGDIEAMARSVLSLLQSPQRAAQFSATARQSAVDHWEHEHILDQYESYFHTILSQT